MAFTPEEKKRAEAIFNKYKPTDSAQSDLKGNDLDKKIAKLMAERKRIKNSPVMKKSFLQKASNVSESIFGGARDMFFGSTGKAVGGLFTSALASGAELLGKETVFGAGVEKLQELGAEQAKFGNIAFTVLETYPGGGQLAKLLRKVPGGDAAAARFAQGIDKLTGKQKEKAIKQYIEALAPTKKAMKRQAEKIAPEAVEREVKGSLKGIQRQAAEQRTVFGEQIGEFLEQLPKTKRTKIAPIIDELQNFKSRYIVDGVVIEPKAIRAADEIAETIAQYGDDISTNSLVSLRRVWDDQIAKRKGFTKFADEITSFNLEAKKEAADAIRRVLAKENPELARLNKEFSFWRSLDDITSETLERTAGQSGRIRQRIAQGVGAAVGSSAGFEGAAAGAFIANKLSGLFNSTRWKTISATTKNNMANDLANGNYKKVFDTLRRLGVITKNEIDQFESNQ